MSSFIPIDKLRRKLKELNFDKSELDNIISKKNKERKAIQEKINATKNRIAKAESEGVKITDHALLRYCERALLVDVGQIQSAIMESLPSELCALIDGVYPLKNSGLKLVIKNNAIVTVQ